MENPTLKDPIVELRERREIWQNKPTLHACYRNWVQTISGHANSGKTLEVGGGSGLLKDLWPGHLDCTDLLKTPWVDFNLDALDMRNVAAQSYDNVIGIDCLHHLKDPERFFTEAHRVLKFRGRLIMLEPWLTAFSFFAYKALHHEDIYRKGYCRPGWSDEPWYGNLALPQILLKHAKTEKNSRFFNGWQLVLVKKMSFLDFQIIGGFKKWSLVKSSRAYSLCLSIDRMLSFMMPLLAFRALIVCQKGSENHETAALR